VIGKKNESGDFCAAEEFIDELARNISGVVVSDFKDGEYMFMPHSITSG